MKVIEVLQSNKQVLACCAPDEPILTISERLTALNIGAMPVCGKAPLIGVISERDVVRAFARHGARLTERYVRTPDDPRSHHLRSGRQHGHAENRMNQHHIRHLPVVDRGSWSSACCRSAT